MTITKSATARLSRVEVGLSLHDMESGPCVLIAVDVGGLSISQYLSLDDFDILRETINEFDVHEALQLAGDAKAEIAEWVAAKCPHGFVDVGQCAYCIFRSQEEPKTSKVGTLVVDKMTVRGGRLHPADVEDGSVEDDSVDPVGGNLRAATMLKSKTHDAWIESIQDFERGPRYVLHYRALDGQMRMQTGDNWNSTRELALHRLHELEQSAKAMVRA